MRVPELGGADPFLLLLDAAATLQRQPYSPFQSLVCNRRVRVWIQELQQPIHRLLNCRGVPTTQRTAEENPPLERCQSALFTKMSPTLREKVADQAEVVR